MNRTLMALVAKFLLTFVMAWVAFGLIDGNSLTNILIVGLMGTVLNYLIGDLLVLPSMGNIVASIGDGILGALTAYIIALFIPTFSTTITSLATFAILIAIGEYFFHQYLLSSKKVAP